jgi:alkanesulfonate monooxygenase SsuD/methylene tetrahydromethanopterin reductase-like flavin-dependent oxidoreductase (luciferase family)
MENHGTPFRRHWKVLRERVEAMKAIWTEGQAEYHGEFVNFDPIWSHPKPLQKPHLFTPQLTLLFFACAGFGAGIARGPRQEEPIVRRPAAQHAPEAFHKVELRTVARQAIQLQMGMSTRTSVIAAA